MASTGEIAGVVAGGVVLFAAISLIPIARNYWNRTNEDKIHNLRSTTDQTWNDSIVMWQHRRRAAARRASELEALREHGCMQQVGVERWLEGQRGNTVACSRSSDNNVHDFGRYAQEPCSICLSTLLPSSSSQSSLPSSDPERPPQGTSGLDPAAEAPTRDWNLLILNRCGHAFHYSCLASWWEYRPYRCPVCQASYAPEE
ncbi:RING finger protein [Aspergillus thermomutatus]|uniref:RING-type domain-containing protein n=1 Tax=Aspergillus thermomutatus TaxID=41047 RepID=A0A397GJM3_ASPTH|nr:uncharacterized protein CDV56_104712 [Aspergillus thermomutatus]RHZ48230.1 hypothetical protein CDV56_104712 [Aspergillus thermomutatus]